MTRSEQKQSSDAFERLRDRAQHAVHAARSAHARVDQRLVQSPLTAATRGRQTALLGFSAIFLALSTGVIRVVDIGVSGVSVESNAGPLEAHRLFWLFASGVLLYLVMSYEFMSRIDQNTRDLDLDAKRQASYDAEHQILSVERDYARALRKQQDDMLVMQTLQAGLSNVEKSSDELRLQATQLQDAWSRYYEGYLNWMAVEGNIMLERMRQLPPAEHVIAWEQYERARRDYAENNEPKEGELDAESTFARYLETSARCRSERDALHELNWSMIERNAALAATRLTLASYRNHRDVMTAFGARRTRHLFLVDRFLPLALGAISLIAALFQFCGRGP